MPTYRKFRPSHCVVAVDGPTFERRRGPYWGTRDVLASLASIESGAVIFRCETEEDEKMVRALLAAEAFALGVDYGVWYRFARMPEESVATCPGVRFEHQQGWEWPDVFGSSQWDPGPMPPDVRASQKELTEGVLARAPDIPVGPARARLIREVVFGEIRRRR